MKKWIVLILTVAIGGTGTYFALRSENKSETRQRSIRLVEAQQGSIEETVEATGVVQPLNRVEIKPPIAGRIERLLIDEGAVVKAGQILGWMSSTDRAAILDAARAKGLEEAKRWEDTYKPTPIIAPLSGTIILRNVVVGQTVDGATVIAAMSDKLIVKANVDETDIGRIQLGMKAEMTLDSYPNNPIEGTVSQILHEGVNVSNVITYPVKILPKDVPPFFRSQMTANIRLIASEKEQAITLPALAVITTANGQKQVMVPGPDGKPLARDVEVGLQSGDSVEIASGVAVGEKVMIVSKRYVPQQAAATSPLVQGARPGQPQTPQQGQNTPRRRTSGTH